METDLPPVPLDDMRWRTRQQVSWSLWWLAPQARDEAVQRRERAAAACARAQQDLGHADTFLDRSLRLLDRALARQTPRGGG